MRRVNTKRQLEHGIRSQWLPYAVPSDELSLSSSRREKYSSRNPGYSVWNLTNASIYVSDATTIINYHCIAYHSLASQQPVPPPIPRPPCQRQEDDELLGWSHSKDEELNMSMDDVLCTARQCNILVKSEGGVKFGKIILTLTNVVGRQKNEGVTTQLLRWD